MRRALRFTVSDGDSPSFRPQPIPAPTLVEVADSDSEMSDSGTGSDGDVVMLPPQLDFLEIFSPPRVCFAAARRGLSARFPVVQKDKLRPIEDRAALYAMDHIVWSAIFFLRSYRLGGPVSFTLSDGFVLEGYVHPDWI